MELTDFVERIETKEDFERFLRLLLRDLAHRRHEWENDTLDLYLSAMERFAGDIEGFYKNRKEEVDLSRPTWRMFARILIAASVYE